jgi:hypothetical protein
MWSPGALAHWRDDGDREQFSRIREPEHAGRRVGYFGVCILKLHWLLDKHAGPLRCEYARQIAAAIWRTLASGDTMSA